MRHIVTTVLLGAFLVWVPAYHNPDTGVVYLGGAGTAEYYSKAKCDARAKRETNEHKKRGDRMFVRCVQIPPTR